MVSTETTGLISGALAALCFGSYGVPMKGEAATRVDVDPLVFQSYKAGTLLFTSTAFILANNILIENGLHAPDYSLLTFHKWTFSDFTPWAFVSAVLWVPGGTAGVYAIRHAGLAISVGIWSCVIVILSYVWGVVIFGEEQKSAWGAIRSVSMVCVGLCGCAYFSSKRVKVTVDSDAPQNQERSEKQGEDSPLFTQLVNHLDVDAQRAMDFHEIALSSKCINHSCHISKYHTGLCMAVVNGILAASILVPLHYAPAATTSGLGYSMSFGIASVLMVMFFWLLRLIWLTLISFYFCFMHWFNESKEKMPTCQILMDSLHTGYQQLPSFHLRVMWKAGITSGVLYSLGNVFGIVSIQKLGDFMGYSLNQTSVIISGMWGLLYYKEIPGTSNMIGFFASTCVVFLGILLMGGERMGHS